MTTAGFAPARSNLVYLLLQACKVLRPCCRASWRSGWRSGMGL